MSSTSQGLDVGKMALEGFGQVMDSMDLVKRAWSNFNLATPFTPTLSVEELDKRIAELRAVEQWLSLNQNMLRNTIRGLEVQRGTLEAISTMSQSFGQMAKPADDALAQTLATFAAAAAQKAATAPTPAEAAEAPAASGFDWSPFGMPSSMFNRPKAGSSPATSATADSRATAAGAAGADLASDAASDAATASPPDAAPDEALDAPAAASSAARQTASRGGAGAKLPRDSRAAPPPGSSPASDAATAAMNPLAWWDMLQANFRQIAQAASLDQGAFAAASKAATAASDSAGTTPRTRARGGGTGSAKGRRAGTATGDASATSGRGKQPKRRKTGGAGGTG